MGRKLSTFVHVDGVAYGPDHEVPDEVAARISAPGVWAESDAPARKDASVAADKPAARRPAAKAAD